MIRGWNLLWRKQRIWAQGTVPDGIVPDGTVPDETVPDETVPDGAVRNYRDGVTSADTTPAVRVRIRVAIAGRSPGGMAWYSTDGSDWTDGSGWTDGINWTDDSGWLAPFAACGGAGDPGIATTPEAVPNGMGVQIWTPAITVGIATGRDATAIVGIARLPPAVTAAVGAAADHAEKTCWRYA
jgi:hypothetical protein